MIQRNSINWFSNNGKRKTRTLLSVIESWEARDLKATFIRDCNVPGVCPESTDRSIVDLNTHAGTESSWSVILTATGDFSARSTTTCCVCTQWSLSACLLEVEASQHPLW